MYSTTHINPDIPPRSTNFLKLKVLCGHCNFKCCNSPSLNVECTPKEAKTLKLPILFPQEGRCRCLGDAGCVHEDKRPAFCQMFPLQVTPQNQLVISHWSILNCPMAHDYELIEHRPKHWTYKRRDDISGAKRNNSDRLLELNKPIEELPTTYENNRNGLALLYTPAAMRTLDKAVARTMQPPRKGFLDG